MKQSVAGGTSVGGGATEGTRTPAGGGAAGGQPGETEDASPHEDVKPTGGMTSDNVLPDDEVIRRQTWSKVDPTS